jgi:uncharacterized protein (DUF927 family)
VTITALKPIMAGGGSADRLRAEITAMKIQGEPSYPTWGGFYYTDGGLHWVDPEDDAAKPVHLCGPLAIRAMVRTHEGNDWGLDLAWSDPDGVPHQWAMPLSVTGGDGVEVRKALLSGGLRVAASRRGREKLTEYLSTVRVPSRALGVHRPGWTGKLYLLPPDLVVGGSGDDRVVFQSLSPISNPFRVSGTLVEWQSQVARYCVGNSRVALALCAGFAAPLLRPTGEDSFGVHFGGSSSTGKTTAVNVACSAWGGGPEGYALSWRATANGIEGQATLHNDGLLALDELGQVSGKEAGDITYLLGNGVGKARARDSGLPQAVFTWRLVYLSSGEMGLATKMAEAGEVIKAGQTVRLLELPADCGPHGVWEDLHGFEDGRSFSQHLAHHARINYGTPIRSYLGEVVPHLEALLPGIRRIGLDFVSAFVPAGSDGQVRRVAARFGLMAAAGEVARACGVLPWPEGEAIRAAAVCFAVWRDRRGTDGALERHEGVQAVLAFLEAHGPSRFEACWEPADNRFPVRNRVGYRKKNPGGGWDYLVFPAAFRDEVAKGHDLRTVLAELARLGILEKAKAGWAKQVSISAVEKPKVYYLRPWVALQQGVN